MKKVFYSIVLLLFALVVNSCKEEETPIYFVVKNTYNSENVFMDYFSPDPSCIEKSYYIYANSNSSEIIIQCTNYEQIFLTSLNSPLKEYESYLGGWKAKLIDEKTILFAFNGIEQNGENQEPVSGDFLIIKAQDKNANVSTSISVIRFMKSSEPLN